MREKYLEQNDYGTYLETRFLLWELLVSRRYKNIDNVKRYCLDKSISFAYSFENIVLLLKNMNIIKAQRKGVGLKKGVAKKISCMEHEEGKFFLVSALLDHLAQRQILSEFIPSHSIKYDYHLNKIAINNNLIPLKYSGIKKLLISFGFFEISQDSNYILWIARKFEDFFVETSLNQLKRNEIKRITKAEMSLQELKNIQNIKNEQGRLAEEYILKYELKRLSTHPYKDRIKIISDIDVSAGYDIVSYDSDKSQDIDRFIEVKSFTEYIGFYWSRNEINIAKLKEDNYYLYLVNRQKMLNENYEPTVIKNPYKVIFCSNNWDKTPEAWHICKNEK